MRGEVALVRWPKESKRVVIDCDDGAAVVESLFDNEIPASFCLRQNWLR